MSIIVRLRLFYFFVLAIAALVALAYELGFATVGALDIPPHVHYVFEIAAVCLTLVFIPLALKFFTIRGIRQRIVRSERQYEALSMVRIAMLATPLHFNLSHYYLLDLDTTCGYLALMTAVTFLFIWPSRDRMEDERIPYDK